MRLTPVLLLGAALAGCGTAPDGDEVRRTAVAFYDAIGEGNGRGACDLLSDELIEQLESQDKRPCREAVTGIEHQGGDVANVHVFITNAKVDLSSGEAVFLSRVPGGWKLSALACRVEEGKPRDLPLECEAEA
jgi:hypothetical protein